MGAIKNKRKILDITERQRRAFDLWKEGATFRQISDALKKQAVEAGESTRGYSREQVRTDINHVLEAYGTDMDIEVGHWKTLQLARLNDQYMTFNAIAKGKIDKESGERARPDVEAGRLVRTIINDISEITGVKAAQKVEHLGKDGAPLPPTQIIIQGVPGRDDDS